MKLTQLQEVRYSDYSPLGRIKQAVHNIRTGQTNFWHEPLNKKQHDEFIKILTKEIGDPRCDAEYDGGWCVWYFKHNKKVFDITVGDSVKDNESTYYVSVEPE